MPVQPASSLQHAAGAKAAYFRLLDEFSHAPILFENKSAVLYLLPILHHFTSVHGDKYQILQIGKVTLGPDDAKWLA